MSFSEDVIRSVWDKGLTVLGYDSGNWRKDACGAWISWAKYGNRDSLYGWEIDHINPHGGDDISNLRPLQWENNVAKGEGRGSCVVTSSGNKNVKR